MPSAFHNRVTMGNRVLKYVHSRHSNKLKQYGKSVKKIVCNVQVRVSQGILSDIQEENIKAKYVTLGWHYFSTGKEISHQT